jgi:hypothetical protein
MNSSIDTGSIAALYGNTDTLQHELQLSRFPGFSGNSVSSIPEKLHCIIAE